MEYKEIIRKKSWILSIALLASILLRSIVNAFFVDFVTIIGLVVAGFVITGVMLFLTKKVNPLVMMYLMVLFLTGISVACMVMFPCTTNFLMFFLAIFMIVLYEDIRPIALQCAASAICMIYFYNKYAAKLSSSWSVDALAMCIVYIASAMFVFWALCRLTGQQFKNLRKSSMESEAAREKAEQLLGEITKSVTILEHTNTTIMESSGKTEEISKRIASESDDVAKMALQEVTATESIKDMMQNGVNEIQEITSASSLMTKVSNETGTSVSEGGDRVSALNSQIEALSKKMNAIASSINELSSENEKIIQILGTLDGITAQTNLLSLNASIEAARAGEHGRGFSVVASEIRNLSETSSQFTNEIHDILNGIRTKTQLVENEIGAGKKSVEECCQHTENVELSFQTISDNTKLVLNHAQKIEGQSSSLNDLLVKTLSEVNHINENVESTSAAMELISKGINELHSNVDQVSVGCNEINTITNSLVKATN